MTVLTMKSSIMCIGYKFIVFGCVSILCASYPLATADIAAKICQPDPGKCLDGLDECKSSQMCYYGTCTPIGTCDCFNCFHGDKCDQYNDYAAPKFEATTDSISIFGMEEETIYQAKAADADGVTECPAEDMTPDTCLCAAIYYSIISDEHQNFFIDSKTGNVFIKNHDNLEKNRQYHITILAQGFLANGTLSTNQDLMDLTVYLEGVEEKQEEEEEEEENSVRVKRDAAGTTEDSTVITLTKVTDPSATETSLGDKIEYQMEIWVPKLTTPMDLKVEIFTSDPETKQAAFALMKPTIAVGSGVAKTPSGDPTIEMHTNHYFSTIYDRATIDFGTVSSTENAGATKGNSLITITFNVITIMINETVTSPYRVSAGAEYMSQSYVWVGQSELTLKTDSVFFDTLATVTGDNTIEQDSFKTYTVESVIAGPSPEVTFAAFLTVGDEDVISIGSIGATAIGSTFSATVDFATDRSLAPPVYAYSVTKNSIVSSSMNVDFIAHEVVTDTTNAKITWIFSVWAIGGVVPLPGDMKLGIAMQFGKEKIWTTVKTLSITASTAAPTGSLTFKSADLASTDPVPPGGTAIIIAKFSLTSGQTDKVDITIQAASGLSHCETRLSMRGFNIPYIPNANSSTITEGQKTTISLGYIGSTGQVTGADVDEFWFEIGIQVGKDTTDGSYDVNIETVPATVTKTASINVQASAQSTDDVSVTIGPSEGSTDMLTGWLTGASAAVDITATFPALHAVSDVSVEGTGMLNNFDFDIRVCKIDVSFMGANVPCIHRGPQEFQKTTDTRKYDDYVIWNVGSMCSAARNPAGTNTTWDNKVVFTVAYEIPLDETVTTDAYSLSAGLKLDPNIWAGLVPFTPSTTKVKTYSGSIQPLWNTRAGLENVPPNMVNIARFYIKMPPGAHVGDLKMEMTVVESELVVCPLQIRFGSGYPCEDDKPFKKWAASDPTTLNYEHVDATKTKGAKKAILDFKNIHNIGTAPLVSSAVFDSNSVEVILPVYVLATGDVTIALTGDGITSFSKTYTFTANSDTATKSTDADVTLNLLEDPSYSGFQNGIAKTALLEVKVTEEFYAEPLVLEISNAQSFNMCCAAAYHVGKNLPCLNASKIAYEQVPEANPDSNGNAIMSTLKVTFDMLCQFPLSKDPDANTLTLMIGFKVAKDATVDPVELSAKAIVNDGSPSAAVTLSIAKSSDPAVPIVAEPDKDGGIDLLDDPDDDGITGEAIDGEIGEFKWIKFGLLTVSSVIAEYQVAAFGRVADTRAEITVHDIRIVQEETGVNVLCVNDAHEFEIIIGKANDSIPESQNNMLLMKLGPIVNTGVSKKISGETPEDNRIVMEVLIRVTDHPLNIHDQEVMVDIGGMTGKLIIITQQPIKIKRLPTDAANILVEVTHNNQTDPFKKNEEVVLSALIHHHNETSKREPAPGTIRFIWGSYMQYKDGSIEVNSTYTSLLNGSSHMDVEFEYILFDDWISINLTLETDPNEVRKPGSGLINAITLVRPVCKYATMAADGGNNPLSTTKLYYYCGDIEYVAYEVDAPECYDNLDFKSLDDTCIIASTEVPNREAAKAKGPTDVWSPAFGPKNSEDYLIIDFQRTVRITVINVGGTSGTPPPPVTKFKLEFADSEYGFQGPQIVTVGNDGKATLAKPVVSRFIRFTIVSTTVDPAQDYIGVNLEFFGCPQGNDPPATCSFQQQTRTNENWRNIASISQLGKEYIYFCYFNEKVKSMNCYCSPDGTTWRAMPSYIGYLVGSKDAYMYAQDQKKQMYLKSPDCEHWEDENSYDSTGVTPAKPLPGSKDASIDLNGGWSATAEGLKKDNIIKARWFDCCS